MKTITIEGKSIEISDESYEAFKKQFIEPEGGWKPALDTRYNYINDGGGVRTDVYLSMGEDLWRMSQRIAWKTEEEAQAHREYLEAVAKIRDSATLVADWEDSDQQKYYVYLSHVSKELGVDFHWWMQCRTFAYYATREDASQAIKDLEAEYRLVFAYEANLR